MVDRPGVQAQQCAQLTGTNITSAFLKVFCLHYLFLIVLIGSTYVSLVIIATGIHPVTFRTRQLSLSSPKILGFVPGRQAVAKLFSICVSPQLSWLEHLTVNQRAAGSSPAGDAIFFAKLNLFPLPEFLLSGVFFIYYFKEIKFIFFRHLLIYLIILKEVSASFPLLFSNKYINVYDKISNLVVLIKY